MLLPFLIVVLFACFSTWDCCADQPPPKELPTDSTGLSPINNPVPAGRPINEQRPLINVVAANTVPTKGKGDPSFERDIRPILKAACFHCHGEAETREGNLDLRLARFLKSGGDSGPAIVPEFPNESLLLQRVRDGEMPPGESHKLTAEKVQTIESWIRSGAKTRRPEPLTLDGPVITPEEASHWSFQPINRPEVPSVEDSHLVANPIDAFILSKLEASQFTFSEPATRHQLIKRIKFALTDCRLHPRRWIDLSTMRVRRRSSV